MTTVTGNTRPSLAKDIRQRVVLVWSLSPQAVIAAGLARRCRSARLEIEVPVPGEHGSVAAELVIDGRVKELAARAEQVLWLPDGSSLVHLDVPGLLRATARPRPGAPHILYARTGVLEQLGIRGGRYDFEGAEVRS